MKQFIVDERLAQAVLDYLSQRPYREVAPLIAGLAQLKEAPKPETAE